MGGGIAVIGEGYVLWVHETQINHKKGLIDYKFYCFDGEPKFLYVSEGLENHATAYISFVSLDWKKLPFWRKDYRPFDILPNKPKKLEEMIGISRKLSKGIKFLRVDLYEIDGQVFFSEFTFHPCSGFMPFIDDKFDYDIGEMLVL